jgi:MOSC domain-containing protein YiiM
MAAHLLSLNVGRAEPSTAKNVGVTGIGKRPVDSAHLRAPGPKHGGLGSGVEGDYIGDTRHHGGDYQAVYAFAREELDRWAQLLGRELPHGMFGENLTTRGLAVDEALVGERWAVGAEVVLEVCGPRIPCATFAARMGERGWVRRFSEVGRTGAYLSVVTSGTVRAGDPIEVVSRPDHGITVPETFRAFMGDLDAAERVLAAKCLVEVEAAELRETVARRRAAGAELDT